ncbi:MAG: outer membrane protein assembly factor BamA [Candidatus Eiseniibacteriota bacterium]
MSGAPSRARSFTLSLIVSLLVAGAAGLSARVASAQGPPVFGSPSDTAAAAQPPAAPAAPAPPAPPIVSFDIEGRRSVDSLRIARTFEPRVGKPFDARAVQAGLRRLWATNLFDDFEVWGRTGDDGVHLTLRVSERPKVARVAFEGLDKIKEEDLAAHVPVRPGDTWRNSMLLAGRDSILTQYRNEGYRTTEVVGTADSTAVGMLVTFKVNEGKKAQVTRIDFVGNEHYTADELRGKLKSKKKGFPFRSGTVKEENLAQDSDKLRTFYRENGYRDVRVEQLPFRADSLGGTGVVLSYKIDEGPFYLMGDTRWQGNNAVSEAALRPLSRGLVLGPYNGTRIQQAVEGAYAMYAEEGYLYLDVQATETVRDSNVVDVAFQISEGPPSHVRKVVIGGNSYTKENVIRRELSIHEGDLFRRSRLVETQQNVFRLGYFEDVGVNFQPAESSNVDILLRIKEKQTGTASAGAGYSSDGGLSGFLNLGHNNLFGNGQSINIQLERGGSRKAVDVSFTDPWFRNTQWQVGGSAFHTDREVGSETQTSYEERRRGFSLQVGRPIDRYIRYTRALARYRLEAVDIRVPLDNPSPQLQALRTAGEQITSSVEFSLVRNSTNNPFYPNRGQRGTVSLELAGGPFAGDYDFTKFRLDSRWYAPSVTRRVATMLRLRAGSLNQYRRGGSVPVYERFRLGGVTYDGLRGYDDYSIVPAENDAFPRYTSGSNVTPGDFTALKVQYPGGRVFGILTFEQQFLVVNPVHMVVFAEGGNTWNRAGDIQLFNLRKSVGLGVRLEIPVLGNVGFDWAYGFDKVNPGWKGHFLFGAMVF